MAERVLQASSSGASGGQTLAAGGSRCLPCPAPPCRLSSWHAHCALQEGLPRVPKYLKVCNVMLRMPSCWDVAARTLPQRAHSLPLPLLYFRSVPRRTLRTLLARR